MPFFASSAFVAKGLTTAALAKQATSGLDADWWVAIAVPGGGWYYFDAYTGGWNPITGEMTPIDIQIINRKERREHKK